MEHKGILPDEVAYVCVLKACAMTGAIDKGKQLHDDILSQGLLDRHIVLGGALVDMYAKFGALPQAKNVLEKLPSRNVVSWTTLITGYVQEGQGQQALECFEQMRDEGTSPNAVTYLCILKACALIGAIGKGKQIHNEFLRQGLLENNIALGNALVDMYAKCGALHWAQSVLEMLPFRDVVPWSTLIAGFADNGQGEQALECFKRMKHEGITPDALTYVSILKACAVIGAIEMGKKIHEEIVRQGLLKHSVKLGGAFVDMYAKCGVLLQARSVLEKLSSRDVIWSSLVTGYAEKGYDKQALHSFEQMQPEGIRPDAVTYTCIVKVCALIGDIDKGKQLHDEILRQGLLEHDIVLGNALADMYAKCGALSQARSVSEELPSRDSISWSYLIAGYAQEGQGEQALQCFEEMQHEGMVPDMATFLCLLNLCSHLGLVEKARELFVSMQSMYGLNPNEDCYTCMVDLLGRSGHLVKAIELIQGLPFPASSSIWLCLLSACRKWVDVNVAIWAFEHAIELDKCNGAGYVLMKLICGEADMLEKAKNIEALRMENKAWKQPGCNLWTDSSNALQKFFYGGTKRAPSNQIHLRLEVCNKMLPEGPCSNPTSLIKRGACCFQRNLVLS